MGKARALKISACYIVKNEAKNLAELFTGEMRYGQGKGIENFCLLYCEK